jgi:hypothetical protein
VRDRRERDRESNRGETERQRHSETEMRDKRQRDDFWHGARLNNRGVRADSHRGREQRKRGERAWALCVVMVAVLLPAFQASSWVLGRVVGNGLHTYWYVRTHGKQAWLCEMSVPNTVGIYLAGTGTGMGTSTRYLVPGTRYVVHKMHIRVQGRSNRNAYCTVPKSAGKYFKVLCSERFQDSPFTLPCSHTMTAAENGPS